MGEMADLALDKKRPVLEFEIPQKAVAWSAPYYTKKGRAFSKEDLKTWQRTVGYYANLAKVEQSWKMTKDCPVLLELEFGFIRPKSNKSKYTIHHYKPDTTNLEKALEDALNNIVWRDDCQIGIKCTKKIWSDRNYVRIKVVDLKE